MSFAGPAKASTFLFMQIDAPFNLVETPAFVYDETEVNRVLGVTQRLGAETGCRICYSVKPLTLPPLLWHMAPSLDGFAVSSPFEARLARACLSGRGSIHFTSPGIRERDVGELASLCDYVSFNSLGQYQRFSGHFSGNFAGAVSLGLRINPGISFLDDERYDPCRPHSKLGVSLKDVADWQESRQSNLPHLDGILLHSNCESTDFSELARTVQKVTEQAPDLLDGISWINLGGGYLFPEGANLDPLVAIIKSLQRQYGLEVFLEPGAAFVRSAGYIVSSVLDVFASGGKPVAVLDTTVNHMPELLEFDFEPDVSGHDEDGPFEYILAGCTCLAGDVFGEYRFPQPLEVGDRLLFRNVGSYTLTKAQMFNGINLPSIYALRDAGRLELLREFGYQDYESRWFTYASSPV